MSYRYKNQKIIKIKSFTKIIIRLIFVYKILSILDIDFKAIFPIYSIYQMSNISII